MNPADVQHPGLKLFTELLAIPAPSGHEQRMARYLVERLSRSGFDPKTDPAGNVLVRLPGSEPGAPTVCLAAHMDEIGMVVTDIASDGTLHVDRLGGLYPWKLGEGPVTLLGDVDEVPAVLSLGSGHSLSARERRPVWPDARVLTGLTTQQLREKGVRRGSPAVPAREVCGPVLFGDAANPMVAAWSFDNRLGVTCLLQLLDAVSRNELSPQCPTIVAFTVEEETGCHGAKGLAQRERPDVLIAVDGSPLVPEYPLELDGRPGIRSKDRVATYDQDLFRDLCRISAAAGVELQPVVYDCAASDASMAYAVGAVPRAACLGYVRESSHGYEVTPLVAFDHLVTTLSAFLAEWRG